MSTTKYYFGYNQFNGNTFPVKWVEEKGVPVGGKPSKVLQKVEITFHDFRNTNLVKLAEDHPYVAPPTEMKPEV